MKDQVACVEPKKVEAHLYLFLAVSNMPEKTFQPLSAQISCGEFGDDAVVERQETTSARCRYGGRLPEDPTLNEAFQRSHLWIHGPQRMLTFLGFPNRVLRMLIEDYLEGLGGLSKTTYISNRNR